MSEQGRYCKNNSNNKGNGTKQKLKYYLVVLLVISGLVCFVLRMNYLDSIKEQKNSNLSSFPAEFQNENYRDGYFDGYDNGFEKGISSDEALEHWYDTLYDEGYYTGYDDGFADGIESDDAEQYWKDYFNLWYDTDL